MTDAPTTERASTGAHRFILAFLALLIGVTVTNTEAWPLTSFHLFSALRHPERTAYAIIGVDDDGAESSLSLYHLPIAYHQTARQLGDFDVWSVTRRDALCDAWLDGFADQGDPHRYIRIYRNTYEVVHDHVTDRQLVYECGSNRP